MHDLTQLIKDKEHTKISQLESPETLTYKCISLIHLEKYDEAFSIVNKNTFEHAYILYKQRKYKKCIKVINKINKSCKDMNESLSDALKILLAQSLYFMGKLRASYNILCEFNSSTIGINLCAIKSLIINAEKTTKPTKYQSVCKDKDDVDFTILDGFKIDDALREEFEFNKVFQCLNDEKEFVKCMEENESNVLVSNLLNNVTGNYGVIDKGSLTKRQREIVENNENGTVPDNLVLFQKESKEYQMFGEAATENYSMDFYGKLRNETSDNSIALKAFVAVKGGKMKEARRLVEKLNDNPRKELFDFLVKKGERSQDEIKNMLSKI